MDKKKKVSSITGSVKLDLIKDFMKKKNLTEAEFAKICKIELVELQKILDDYFLFEPIWLLKIARKMGVDFEDLVN